MSEKDRQPIEFHATIAKVQTLADGGIRVTLDLPETAVLQMAQLVTVRVQMGAVDAVLTPVIIPEFKETAKYERIND